MAGLGATPTARAECWDVEFARTCCQAVGETPASRPAAPSRRRTVMPFTVGHVHIKTQDAKKTAQFYMDNFGATMKREVDGRGFQLDLHGLQLNVTTIIDTQKHEQKLGIEHIAVQTDDYPGTLDRLKANGAKILEELFNNGRHVCWVEAPDGAQMEVIEKV
jgi:predicted enzyme related to lactoylglutathione lyase